MDAREYKRRQVELVHDLHKLGDRLTVFGDDLMTSKLPEQVTVAGVAKSLSYMTWMIGRELHRQVEFSHRLRSERLNRRKKG